MIGSNWDNWTLQKRCCTSVGLFTWGSEGNQKVVFLSNLLGIFNFIRDFIFIRSENFRAVYFSLENGDDLTIMLNVHHSTDAYRRNVMRKRIWRENWWHLNQRQVSQYLLFWFLKRHAWGFASVQEIRVLYIGRSSYSCHEVSSCRNSWRPSVYSTAYSIPKLLCVYIYICRFDLFLDIRF
jgi:hypothetical protein